MPAFAHAAVLLCQAAAALLVAGAWQAALLAVAVGLVLRAAPGLPAGVRHAAWCCVLLLSAALPFRAVLRMHQGSINGDVLHREGLLHLHMSVAWSLAFAGAWLLVALVRSAYLVRSALNLRGLCRRAQPLLGSDGNPMIASGWRGAAVCTSDDVTRPSVVGFLSPRILIPSQLYATLTPGDLRNVILHEQGHLDRLDDWMNLLQKMVVAVFPLNPALVWMERRLCLEREIACDERVLQVTQAPRSYAACLVHLAENRMLGAPISLALGAWEHRSDLAQRVHQILRRQGRSLSTVQALTFSLLLMAAVAGGGYELSLAPPLVSFAPAAAAAEDSSNASVAGDAWSGAAMVEARPAARMVPASIRVPLNSAPSMTRPVRPTRLTKKTRPALALVSRTARLAHPDSTLSQTASITSASQYRSPVVLTASQDASPEAAQPATRAETGSRVTFTFVSTYAAVPTENGWLIIQL